MPMNKAQQARAQSSHAIQSGILKPSATCELCGLKKKVDGHHEDYDKPLEVRWLCRRCHMKADGRLDKFLADIKANVFKAVITRDRNKGQLRLGLAETNNFSVRQPSGASI